MNFWTRFMNFRMWLMKKDYEVDPAPYIYPVLFARERSWAEDFAAWLDAKKIPNEVVNNDDDWIVRTDSEHYHVAHMEALIDATVHYSKVRLA